MRFPTFWEDIDNVGLVEVGVIWLLVSQHYMFLLIRSCDMDLSEGEEGEVNFYLFFSN